MVPAQNTAERLLTLEALYQEQGRIARAQVAPMTEFGYANDWRAFTRWCASRGFDPLPASGPAVLLFATDWLARGRKTSSVRRLVSGIAYHHRREGHTVDWLDRVDELLAGARRLHTETLEQVAPLALEDLRQISERLAAEPTPRKLRNRAILLAGFASALRSASLVALELADLEFRPEGAILHIRREKNDQDGKGRLIGLPHGKHLETDAVEALRVWIERRGSFPGPLFTHIRERKALPQPLRPKQICVIVQRALERAGREWRGYGSHSMRAGLVTAAGEQHVGEYIIAAQTGHRSMQSVRRYFRRRDLFAANPLLSLDL